MKNILTIMKKELKRFFGDRRMLLSLILPGLIVFVLYTIMGQFIGSIGKGDANHDYNVYIVNNSNDKNINDLHEVDKYKITINEVDEDQIDAIKEDIKTKTKDLLIVFEKDFDAKKNNGTSPTVDLYYNSTNDNSQEIYTYYLTGLSEKAINDIKYNYLINGGVGAGSTNNLATKEDVSSQVITMIVPYILIIFLFTGCMGIATESIAGEKERGTIATLLVTPTKRRDIALGKILALSITSVFSSVVTFIAVIASVPNMMGGVSESGITLSMYGVKEILLILLFIVLAVLLFTSILTVLSTLAKSIKEATQYAMPIMVITMMIGVLSMSGNIPTNPALYLVPVYNIAMGLTSVFAGKIDALNIILATVSNVVYIAGAVFALTKLFNNEKIMFSK